MLRRKIAIMGNGHMATEAMNIVARFPIYVLPVSRLTIIPTSGPPDCAVELKLSNAMHYQVQTLARPKRWTGFEAMHPTSS